MPTILLEQIIELLTGWKDSFFTWANAIGDKIASIKTNTDSLPDIKANTDDIKDNTAAVITPISNINTNVTSISSDTASIRTDTGIIKNNAQAIATSSGAAAAFAEDVANNTLEVKNKITTIASDTTQMRADSGSIRADVSEIKETLGLYLYNTIVTEDAQGPIANFDTDLQDYLQEAKVMIPADAGGISGLTITDCGVNLWNGLYEIGNILPDGSDGTSTSYQRIVGYIKVDPGKQYYQITPTTTARFYWYDENFNFISNYSGSNRTQTAPNNAHYLRTMWNIVDVPDPVNTLGINYPASDTSFHDYISSIQTVSFSAPITDGAEVDLLSGIVKINTSPVSYDSITPLAIRTFKGVNNIYSDIGDMAVTYRETLKHYLKKQENNSRSLNRNVNLLRENTESLDLSDEDSNRRI